jgi:16S rRNA processing protein RimM
MGREHTETAWICVAAVATAHGVHGALRLRCFTEQPDDVAAYGPLFDRRGQRLFEITIIGHAKGGVIVRASGIDDREAAEALRGAELFVPRSALPDPADDEFYYQDLEGLVALNTEANRIGVVKQVVNHGAGDLIEIAGDDGGSLIFPFDKRTVPTVDLAGRTLTVAPPNEIVAEPER